MAGQGPAEGRDGPMSSPVQAVERKCAACGLGLMVSSTTPDKRPFSLCWQCEKKARKADAEAPN